MNLINFASSSIGMYSMFFDKLQDLIILIGLCIFSPGFSNHDVVFRLRKWFFGDDPK